MIDIKHESLINDMSTKEGFGFEIVFLLFFSAISKLNHD